MTDTPLVLFDYKAVAQTARDNFKDALSENLNVPAAYAVVFELGRANCLLS